MDKLSYAFGFGIANQFKQLRLQGKLVVEDFADAVSTILKGEETKITDKEAEKEIEEYFKKFQMENQAVAEENIKVGQEFLNTNQLKEGVVTTPSGLQYEVITKGEGKVPTLNTRVRCHYEGRLLNGTIFDSSIKRGEPAIFDLKMVIQGWQEGILLMNEGAKYRFYIPYNLAYGTNEAGMIPAGSTLIFDVELLEVGNEPNNEKKE